MSRRTYIVLAVVCGLAAYASIVGVIFAGSDEWQMVCFVNFFLFAPGCAGFTLAAAFDAPPTKGRTDD